MYSPMQCQVDSNESFADIPNLEAAGRRWRVTSARRRRFTRSLCSPQVTEEDALVIKQNVHDCGFCTPCAFFTLMGSCKRGQKCGFCHFHSGSATNYNKTGGLRMWNEVEELDRFLIDGEAFQSKLWYVLKRGDMSTLNRIKNKLRSYVAAGRLGDDDLAFAVNAFRVCTRCAGKQDAANVRPMALISL
eukprot:TRINITY_DN21439_c0_g1_i1.p1 TRINITY_DN21439_c0_g1~~TRINITY_DN21439_c0_g1_i1.p1  ORF type:complete len:189 (+),score=19.63 TRINITY_DN21439_c0_g1_i1:40-606(+)